MKQYMPDFLIMSRNISDIEITSLPEYLTLEPFHVPSYIEFRSWAFPAAPHDVLLDLPFNMDELSFEINSTKPNPPGTGQD